MAPQKLLPLPTDWDCQGAAHSKDVQVSQKSERKGLSVETPTGISYIFLAPTLLAQTWLLTKSVRGNSYFNRGIQYVEEPLKP